MKDCSVLVTGGSKGIGYHSALAFAENGSKVAVLARDGKDIQEAVRLLRKTGNENIVGIQGDISNQEENKQILQKVVTAFGSVDVLVNSAGINRPKSTLEITEEDWDQILDINLKGAFFLSQEVCNQMVQQKSGKIINISSQMGHVGYYGRTAYCASKGGLELMTKAMAVELAEYNIQINTVAPTFIETSLTEEYFKDDYFKEKVINNIPLKKIGKPKDVVGAVLYLASDMSNLVTGTSLKVDGGWTAW